MVGQLWVGKVFRNDQQALFFVAKRALEKSLASVVKPEPIFKVLKGFVAASPKA